MRRLNPVGSLLGFVLTILLLVGLGVSLWVNRGLAFNPGKVTSLGKEGVTLQGFKSHAEFEKQCVYCHEPLKTDLATKCLDCHVEVSEQVQTQTGAHSHINSVEECADCHPEHLGRDFNPTMAAYQLFDHSRTAFSLNWHQTNYDTTPMSCEACHQGTGFNAVKNQTCFDCHAGHDQNFRESHPKNFGENCLSCHDGLDKMQGFDHALTKFPVDGKHGQVMCTGCHTTDKLDETPTGCINCHEEPTMHKGLFVDQSCEVCHTPAGWSPALIEGKPFAHLEATGFSLALHQLDYEKQELTCSACHTKDLQSLDGQVCIDCHKAHDEAFMTDHLQQFGFDCMVCHDGVDRLSNFDHANFFPLEGKHAEIQCSDCHSNQAFRGTPAECWQCHQEPEIHAGVFGLECDACHSAQAWSPAILAKHSFPLNHGQQDPNLQLKCDVCHVNNYIEFTCYTCHDHVEAEIIQKHLEENIPEQDIPDCAKCHPTGTVIED